MEVESGSLMISLFTYPRENSTDEFISTVEENIKKYKTGKADHYIDFTIKDKDVIRNEQIHPNSFPKEISSNLKKNKFYLYHNPIKYHIWGKYDIAFIILSENFALSNKVFLPTRLRRRFKQGYLKTHVLSGIPFKSGDISIEEKFSKLLGYDSNSSEKDSAFICISNFKFNNAFYLGNGLHYIERIVKFIEAKLLGEKILFQIVKSFSASEFTLLLFSNDINEIKEKILEIRGIRIDQLFSENDEDFKKYLIQNSILSEEEKKKKSVCLNSHVFADSQSFFGVRLDENNDWTIKEFPDFKTHVEWEIRPGHEKFIKKYFINEKNKLAFSAKQCFFIPGKTDFCFESKIENLSNNYFLYKLFNKSKGEDSITNHVRSVKTKIIFQTNKCQDEEYHIGRTNGNKEIQKLLVSTSLEINKISTFLKKLKLPNVLRNRLLKIFYNFESAIQNPLVSSHFIDLAFFIKYLKDEIIKLSDEIDNFYNGQIDQEVKRVFSIERKLSDLITHFEDAFNIRYINNYSFEGVSDFLINYNSPIQQVITSLDNYFKALYSLIVEDDIARIVFTRVNELQTQSTATSVNFAIYNLYEPGILFYSATKEIFTAFFKDDNNERYSKEVVRGYKNFHRTYFTLFSQSLAIYHKNALKELEPLNFLIDVQRFSIFFDGDFKKFLFWHLSYLIQLPAVYNLLGDLDKEQFTEEFIRLLFLAIYLDIDNEGGNVSLDIIEDRVGPNEKILIENCPKPQMLKVWRHIYSEVRHFIVHLLLKNDESFHFKLMVGSKVNFYQLIRMQTKHRIGKIGYRLDTDKQDLKKSFVQKKYRMNKIDTTFFNAVLNKENGEIIVSELDKYFKKGFYKDAMFSLTKSYLTKIYEESLSDDSFDIPFVNRDWKTGEIEKKIPKYNSYYLFDPSGGVFFHSFERSKRFSLVRNKVFMVLFHHSCLMKESLFSDFRVKSNS